MAFPISIVSFIEYADVYLDYGQTRKSDGTGIAETRTNLSEYFQEQ